MTRAAVMLSALQVIPWNEVIVEHWGVDKLRAYAGHPHNTPAEASCRLCLLHDGKQQFCQVNGPKVIGGERYLHIMLLLNCHNL